MKDITTILITALLVLLMAGSAMGATPVLVEAPRNDAAPTEPANDVVYACGFMAPPHVTLQEREAGHWAKMVGTSSNWEKVGGFGLPAAFDWRDHGGVSAVKDQEQCGSCYAFAFAGQAESLLMIDGANETNLSENNLKEGSWLELTGYGCPDCWGSCNGGNALMCANLFSTWGSVDETPDPYIPDDVGYDYGAPREDIFTEWHLMSGNTTPPTADLKAVILQQPVYTTIYADAEFFGYDGSYVLVDEPSFNYTNHAVMIIGWDGDDEDGLWICKNSYGTGWGQEGFFYIKYGVRGIGQWTSYSTEYHEARGDERLYYNDEAGWWNSVGWWDGDDFTRNAKMLVEYTPGPCENATSIEFWATDNCTVDVALYGSFDDSPWDTGPGDMLANSCFTNSVYADAGYYSVEFDHEVPLPAGEPVYVYVYIDGPTYPIPTDHDVGPYVGAGKQWVKPGAEGWRVWDSPANGDLGVRMRTVTHPCTPVPEIPTLAAVGLGICMIGIFARRKP